MSYKQKVNNTYVDKTTLPNQIDVDTVVELTIKDCHLDFAEGLPEMPRLKKIRFEYCRGEDIILFTTQQNLSEVSFFRCDATTIDFETYRVDLERVMVKDCRYLEKLVGVDELRLQHFTAIKCPFLKIPFLEPANKLLSFGWRDMRLGALPLNLIPKVKWLDVSRTHLNEDPNLTKLTNLSSVKLEDTTRDSRKPLRIPRSVHTVVVRDPTIVSPVDTVKTRIVVTPSGKGRPESRKFMSKTVLATTDRLSAREKQTASEEDESEIVEPSQPIFSPELESSEKHKVYLDKVRRQAWNEFDESEFKHFLIKVPTHALVKLDICSQYNVAKKVHRVAASVYRDHPNWVLFKPTHIVTNEIIDEG